MLSKLASITATEKARAVTLKLLACAALAGGATLIKLDRGMVLPSLLPAAHAQSATALEPIFVPNIPNIATLSRSTRRRSTSRGNALGPNYCRFRFTVERDGSVSNPTEVLCNPPSMARTLGRYASQLKYPEQAEARQNVQYTLIVGDGVDRAAIEHEIDTQLASVGSEYDKKLDQLAALPAGDSALASWLDFANELRRGERMPPAQAARASSLLQTLSDTYRAAEVQKLRQSYPGWTLDFAGARRAMAELDAYYRDVARPLRDISEKLKRQSIRFQYEDTSGVVEAAQEKQRAILEQPQTIKGYRAYMANMPSDVEPGSPVWVYSSAIVPFNIAEESYVFRPIVDAAQKRARFNQINIVPATRKSSGPTSEGIATAIFNYVERDNAAKARLWDMCLSGQAVASGNLAVANQCLAVFAMQSKEPPETTLYRVQKNTCQQTETPDRYLCSFQLNMRVDTNQSQIPGGFRGGSSSTERLFVKSGDGWRFIPN